MRPVTDGPPGHPGGPPGGRPPQPGSVRWAARTACRGPGAHDPRSAQLLTARPAAPGSPWRCRPAGPGAPVPAARPARPAGSRRRGCAGRPGQPVPSGSSRGSQRSSSACSAGLPTRIGGFDQIAAKPDRRPGRRRVAGAQPAQPRPAGRSPRPAQGPVVHVDGPDRAPGAAQRHRQRQRAPAAAEVEQVARPAAARAPARSSTRVPRSRPSGLNTPSAVKTLDSSPASRIAGARLAGAGRRTEVVLAGASTAAARRLAGARPDPRVPVLRCGVVAGVWTRIPFAGRRRTRRQ